MFTGEADGSRYLLWGGDLGDGTLQANLVSLVIAVG